MYFRALVGRNRNNLRLYSDTDLHLVYCKVLSSALSCQQVSCVCKYLKFEMPSVMVSGGVFRPLCPLIRNCQTVLF